MSGNSQLTNQGSRLLIKVCGMRDPENIAQVAELNPDYMGFIFQPISSRYVGQDPNLSVFERVPPTIPKIGVFVNEDPDVLIGQCKKYGFFGAQLHGTETPDYCRVVGESGLTVIKAFSLHDAFNFSITEAYTSVAGYFLFDTKGQLAGGTGLKFNWEILDRYRFRVPFFLSGGIGPGDAQKLKSIGHPQLFGIDMNSGFETAPALKEVGKVKKFMEEIRS